MLEAPDQALPALVGALLPAVTLGAAGAGPMGEDKTWRRRDSFLSLGVVALILLSWLYFSDLFS